MKKAELLTRIEKLEARVKALEEKAPAVYALPDLTPHQVVYPDQPYWSPFYASEAQRRWERVACAGDHAD